MRATDDSPDPARTTPTRLADELDAIGHRLLKSLYALQSLAAYLDDVAAHNAAGGRLAEVVHRIADLASAVRLGRESIRDDARALAAGRGDRPLLDRIDDQVGGVPAPSRAPASASTLPGPGRDDHSPGLVFPRGPAPSRAPAAETSSDVDRPADLPGQQLLPAVAETADRREAPRRNGLVELPCTNCGTDLAAPETHAPKRGRGRPRKERPEEKRAAEPVDRGGSKGAELDDDQVVERPKGGEYSLADLGLTDSDLEKIEGTCSADKIQEGKIRGVVLIRGFPYVNTGGGGTATDYAVDLTPLYRLNEWTEPTHTYVERTASGVRGPGFYQGIRVSCRGMLYVLAPGADGADEINLRIRKPAPVAAPQPIAGDPPKRDPEFAAHQPDKNQCVTDDTGKWLRCLDCRGEWSRPRHGANRKKLGCHFMRKEHLALLACSYKDYEKVEIEELDIAGVTRRLVGKLDIQHGLRTIGALEGAISTERLHPKSSEAKLSELSAADYEEILDGLILLKKRLGERAASTTAPPAADSIDWRSTSVEDLELGEEIVTALLDAGLKTAGELDEWLGDNESFADLDGVIEPEHDAILEALTSLQEAAGETIGTKPAGDSTSIDRLGKFGLTAATRKVLARNELNTIGLLEAYLDGGQRLTMLPGLRTGQAEKILEALSKYDDERVAARAELEAGDDRRQSNAEKYGLEIPAGKQSWEDPIEKLRLYGVSEHVLAIFKAAGWSRVGDVVARWDLVHGKPRPSFGDVRLSSYETRCLQTSLFSFRLDVRPLSARDDLDRFLADGSTTTRSTTDDAAAGVPKRKRGRPRKQPVSG